MTGKVIFMMCFASCEFSISALLYLFSACNNAKSSVRNLDCCQHEERWAKPALENRCRGSGNKGSTSL